jgi:hypothetical protein
MPNKVVLSLLRDGQIISTIQADKLGAFQFVGNFPNGDYAIKASSLQFAGELLIKIDSYKVVDTLIVMHRVP